MNIQELVEWIKDNKSKAVAIIIACFYLLISTFIGEVLRVLLFLILPLACIFFSDAMGGYEGPSGVVRPWITRTTSGCFVAFAGWLLLLFPLLFAVFKAIFK